MTASTLFSAVFGAGRESQTAVLYEQREIAYDELRAETIRTAEALHALGLEQGDRVAILLHDSPEFIASFVAIQSLGAIAVPINMGLRTDEQEKILSDCTARAAIVEADLCNTLLTDASGRLRHLKDLLVVGRDQSLCAGEIAGVNTKLLADAPRSTLSGDFPVKPTANTPAFILYTSGSTGDPKG